MTVTARLARFALIPCLAAAIGTARASTSFDFLFNVSSVHDDSQFFLNVAVGDSGFGRPVLEPILPRVRYVDQDLPVILFLARHSGRPPVFIVDLRAKRLSWAVIFQRVGVPYDVLFTGIDRDPGPPYGKAWGYWKKHPARMTFSDTDIRGLVRVQLGTRIAGVSPYELARDCGRGRPVAFVVADRKGRPFSKGVPPGQAKKGGKPKDNGQGKPGKPGNGN
jgi:hypothetical protein